MSEKSEVIVDNMEYENDSTAVKKLVQSLSENRRRKINSELAKGYCEMAEINIELAEEGVNSDNYALKICEQKLAESECCDS